MSELISLNLRDEQKVAIDDFVRKCPIMKEHIETYYESLESKSNQKKKDLLSFSRSQRVVPPPPDPSEHILDIRMKLPTFKQRQDILESIQNHSVTLITGGTGCGKTTQVPQFILEDAYSCNRPVRIFCTQPRRLSTIAISKRVAAERDELVGSTVGYHIRLEQRTSDDTALIYCTSGILLRMLTTDELASDMTHIILDEIHEREQNTDYLLILLKQALKKRDDLKVILMSATMEGNLDTFMNYFDSRVAHIDIPSKMYHVDKFYLADVLAMTDFLSKISAGKASGSNEFEFAQQFGRSLVVGEFPPANRTSSNSTEGGRNSLSRSFLSNGPRSSSPDLFGESNAGFGFGRFGFKQSRRSNLEEAIKHLNKVLPNRPRSLDPNFIETLRRSNLRRNPLVDTYMNIGGCKFSDVVDAELITRLVVYLMDSPIPGAILVFLPGYDDIMQVNDRLLQKCVDVRTTPKIFMLHSQINPQDHQRVFEPAAKGCRKIVLSTNIAEASVTIDDVVFVVDSGKVKEKTYDHNTRISQLKICWIAKSNAEQRAGRAGRCRNGYCFRLYSEDDYEHLLDTQIPEMRRSPIYDVCLHAKMFAPEGMSVKKFLEMAPEPPSSDAVEKSLEFLEIGALYTNKGLPPPTSTISRFAAALSRSMFREPQLTDLGRTLAFLPLDPQLSRLLLFGLALKCFGPIVTLVSALSYRDPFILPTDEEERDNALGARDEFGRRDFSDHLVLIRAFNAYSEFTQGHHNFCRSKFLSLESMKLIHGIRKQLVMELKRLNFLPSDVFSHDHPKVNTFRSCWPMIQGAIVAGCYPGIGVVKDGIKLRKIKINTGQIAHLHPSSVIKRQVLRRNKKLQAIRKYSTDEIDPAIDFLVYQELSKCGDRITLKMATVVPPLTVFLFAGPVRVAKDHAVTFNIDEPIKESPPPPPPKKTVFLSPWSVSTASNKITNLKSDGFTAKPFPNVHGLPSEAFSMAKSEKGDSGDLSESDDENCPSVRDDDDQKSTGKKHSSDEERNSQVDSDDSDDNCSMELDPWLVFNADYRIMQSVVRLRFKFMSYFSSILKNPTRDTTEEEKAMLHCISHVLDLDHKRNFFGPCDDLSRHKRKS